MNQGFRSRLAEAERRFAHRISGGSRRTKLDRDEAVRAVLDDPARRETLAARIMSASTIDRDRAVFGAALRADT